MPKWSEEHKFARISYPWVGEETGLKVKINPLESFLYLLVVAQRTWEQFPI